MIRRSTREDTQGLLAVAEAAGLFEPHELEVLTGMLAEHFDAPDDAAVWLTDDEPGRGPVGVAYVAPERMAEGTWNLLLIAVHPKLQKSGRGAAMLRHVEEMLAEQGERLLLVETLGLDDFEYVRRFYRKHGYEQEARIREYYAAGADKIVFRKSLA
ncbi:MAG: GNAT family N-acetyltransferase [Planctomycetota bacterium]